MDHYADVLVERASRIEELSTILVADGYFAKKKFVDAMADKTNLELISRLCDDANLNYMYNGLKKIKN